MPWGIRYRTCLLLLPGEDTCREIRSPYTLQRHSTVTLGTFVIKDICGWQKHTWNSSLRQTGLELNNRDPDWVGLPGACWTCRHPITSYRKSVWIITGLLTRTRTARFNYFWTWLWGGLGCVCLRVRVSTVTLWHSPFKCVVGGWGVACGWEVGGQRVYKESHAKCRYSDSGPIWRMFTDCWLCKKKWSD